MGAEPNLLEPSSSTGASVVSRGLVEGGGVDSAAASPARMPQAQSASVVPQVERRAELDLMRAFVVAGLVVFHSAVVFAWGTSWFVNDPHPSVGFTLFLGWGSLWGMPLLFLVSGMGVRYALRARPAPAFARERLARLLLPFVTGLVVLVPPMFYLHRLGEFGFHESYWHFWLRFLDVPAMVGGLLSHGSWAEFDPAHTWFLYVLFLWSMLLLPLFLYLRGLRGSALVNRAAGLADRHATVVLFGAAIPVIVVEAALGPDVDTGGWERLAYLFFLLYGYLIASDRRFEASLRRTRRPAAALAVVLTAALVAWAAALGDSADVKGGGVPGLSALQAFAGWLWVVAILGFAGSFMTRRGGRSATKTGSPSERPEPRWRRAAGYANEAVLPFYVLHEPVIVAAAWVIVRWEVPIIAKYVALVIVSFVGTLALYETLVRRFRIPRFLLGMKPGKTSDGW
jgi:glucans biosynthesis protein C